MASRCKLVSRRSRWALAAVMASGAALGTGCNSILGIDEGYLVSADSGAGGVTVVDSGAGGAASVDAGTGGTNDGGAGGSAMGGSAGSGGNATGGAGSGGKASGGTGGAGSGGRATGGAAGSGTGGTGGATGPAGVPGEVRCGDATCRLPSQLCCVTTTTGEAHCATSCDSNSQLPVSCDGAEDCSASKPKCCYPTGGTAAACMATCQGRVFCGKDADCAPGQRCAPGTGALATVFTCVAVTSAKTIWCGDDICDVAAGEGCCYDKTSKTQACAKSCSANVVRFACDSTDDCASGSACCETHTGVGVSTGTQCVAGGCMPGQSAVACGGANACAAGEQCCLQGSGSSCTATCGGQIACGTEADCAAGEACAPISGTAIGTPTGRPICTTPP